MHRSFLAVLLAILACLFLSDAASAQGGYTKEKFKQHGLTLDIARDYDWLAIQPNEEWVKLQWVRSKGQRGLWNPKLQVVRIDFVGDPGPDTPGRGEAEPEPKAKDENAKNPETDGEEKEEKPKPELPINSWERYQKKKFAKSKFKAVGEMELQDGYESTEYESIARGKGRLSTWVRVFEKSKERTFLLIGTAHPDEFETQRKIWRYTAKRLQLYEPAEDPDVVKWRRYYERRPKYKSPEYRVRVRLGLEGGWKAEDTENYIVIYNTKDQPLVRRIVNDMEYIRKEYAKLFPPEREIEAVSTVRICADQDEYMAYGGMTGSAGYWYYVTEELVFYDATKREKGKKTEKANTFIVLYHEAFHQYIYYCVGQVSPHYWYNEGFGDFFSGAQIIGGKVKRVGPNPWRLGLIQRAIDQDEYVPWNEMLRYERKDYYGAGRSRNYAQGWSMVYFLNTSKVVQKNELWAGILPRYFNELKRAWVLEQSKLVADGNLENTEELGAAQLRARTSALDVAFSDVDIYALEEEWIRYTLSLKL
ncbi:MAG: hypothetical protein ACI8X5_002152 [Planctomycetota bacterium]|jgi:hypothetical protein